MNKELVIGILGGMGPEATFNCFGKLIKNTPANSDQEHLRIIIDNNPKVPDRTRAILGHGDSPLPVLIKGISSLKNAGADFVIIPCVTVHYFLGELQKNAVLPVLSILDAVSGHIKDKHSQLKTVGLLGTDGTIKSSIFQKRLAAEGINTVVCNDKYQQQVMRAIYDIKRQKPACTQTETHNQAEIKSSLIEAAGYLISLGAQGIIAGCTEIPLALEQSGIKVPYFDSLLILARSAIRRAGKEPSVLELENQVW